MNKTQIKAEIVADSTNPQGDRLISVLVTFPRIILAEVNTHRMLSKNTSSSRAIPFEKMVEAVENNPFIPIAWQKEHKGMQGSEYLTEFNSGLAQEEWLKARDLAIQQATILNKGNKIPNSDGGLNVTKQLCNRLLEPFMWTTMLITGSKEGWGNFFELRCPVYDIGYMGIHKSWKEVEKAEEHFYDGAKIRLYNQDTPLLERLSYNKGQAEIHMMDLAEKIYDAMNESTPRQLKAGEYHIPFGDKIDRGKVSDLLNKIYPVQPDSLTWHEEQVDKLLIKISTALSARTSYTVVGDEKEIDYQKMINLHDRLISQDPPHSSPMEHCAKAMSEEEYHTFIKGKSNANWDTDLVTDNTYEISAQFDNNVLGWCRNFKGFIQYRHLIEENQQ